MLFFSMHKTAYEMRISDWSSDVCPSNKSQLDELADTAVQYDDEDKDTVTLAGEEGTAIGNVAAGSVSATSMDAINRGQLYGALDSAAQMLGGGAAVTAFGTISAPTYMVQGGNYFNVGDALRALDGALSGLDSRVTELGRASCRERVCQ